MPRLLCAGVLGGIFVATLHAGAQAQADGSSTIPGSTVAGAPTRVDAPKILPGTRPGVFSTIQGNALTSTSAALANARVRLRDARTGVIVGTQVTDQSGLFAFRKVDPGSYIVEILAPDQASVLAASQVLYVGAGEVKFAVVKLPFKISPFSGILGHSTSSAAIVVATAAAAGVMATQVSGAATCIPLQ